MQYLQFFPGGFRHMNTNGGRFSLQRALARSIVLVALLAVSLATLVQPAGAQAPGDSAAVGGVAASAAPTITTLEVGTVVIDEEADRAVVPIRIHPGPTPIAAFQLEIVFNADALTPIGCAHLSGFGVCAPKGDGHLELNAARVESWTASTDVIELTFTVREGAAIRVGVVAGVWGDESTHLAQIDYDIVFGAVYVGDQREASADQLPGPAVDDSGAITGTASSGVHESGLYGAGVCALNEHTHHARCSATNSRGEFRIDGLTPGPYLVEYLGADGERPLHRHSGVLVESGTMTQGIDFDLNKPAMTTEVADDNEALTEAQPDTATAAAPTFAQGEIVGSIADTAGQPVTAVMVCAADVGIGTTQCGASRLDGTYRIQGLHAGNYVVTVTDPGQRFVDATSAPFGFDALSAEQIDFTLTR